MGFLSDDWNKTGKDKDEFSREIKKLSNQTKIEMVNMDDFNFLNITDTGTELVAFPLNAKNLWKKTKASISLKKYQVDMVTHEL